MLNNLSIRIKLALLAGVPVIGALALASLLWMHAQKSEKAAAALGSVEDLAELSVRITSLVHGLQMERATLGLTLGHELRATEEIEEDIAARHKKQGQQQRQALLTRVEKTDRALVTLVAFLETKNLSALPKRLTGNLQTAREQLSKLDKIRSAKAGELPVGKVIAFYAGANRKLIDATAALTQLSDDGELLRAIATLVGVLQVKERGSQEHALLSHVFAASTYTPGTYRTFVTLRTQEQDYIDVLRSNANDQQVKLYETSMQSPAIKRSLIMSKKALATLDDDFGFEAADWFKAQDAKIDALRKLETLLTAKVHAAALAKLRETRAQIRNSLGLSAGVLAASVLLGILIARGVNLSIRALGKAAKIIDDKQDYSARATKCGDDELGALTDTFNHMLAGIQKRDGELEEYRAGLEEKVKTRTAELSERNDAMRLVLDNVEQGLVTINPDGSIETERSAIFDTWFGSPANDTHFSGHLSPEDEDAADWLELGWDEVIGAILPPEMSLELMPKSLIRDGSHYTLSYKAIGDTAHFKGALLIVSNITEEVKRIKKEAEQREFINVFERVMKDKNGFLQFFNDTERIVTRVLSGKRNVELVMRDIHTVKGNCGIFHVDSVAQACHQIESDTEPEKLPQEESLATLGGTWQTFAARVRALLDQPDGDTNAIQIAHPELEFLLRLVTNKAPYSTLQRQLEELRFEPSQTQLERVGDQAISIAQRLGKPNLRVTIESDAVRLPTERWAAFWSSFAHVLRNAVDHGIELPTDRKKKGKSAAGHLHFVAKKESSCIVIELHDDGAGIAWQRIKEKAAACGMPHATQEELENALFSDGVTSRDTATELSGRGVGMAAIQQVTHDMGGDIAIESEPDRGTVFRFRFPIEGNHDVPADSSKSGPRLNPSPSKRSA